MSTVMGLTFLMSYPGTDWTIRGGANSFSESKQATNPRAALQEWLRLGDLITHAGGRILVMPPVEKASGQPYTSNLGSLFRQTQGAPFLVGHSAAKHRAGEDERAASLLAEAGVPIVRTKHTWEGQSEVILLKGNRVILIHGPRSQSGVFDEIRPMLVPGSRVLDVEIAAPYTHGDMVVSALYTRGGDCVLLAWGQGLASRSVPELRSFVGSYAEVLPIEDPEDAAKMATQTLSVGGHAILPEGLSTGFRANLIRRGFVLEEVALPELLGKGGGGPRALVNELHGLVLAEEGPTYANLRESIAALVDKYPESVSAKAEPAPAKSPGADEPKKPSRPKK